MNYKKLIFILFPLMLISCGGYEKLLKSSDYQLKYNKAYEYYSEGEYVRAATVYEQIANIYRGTTRSDTIEYYKAKSYYGQNDFTMAGHYFKSLAESNPNGPYCEESFFMSAYCLYKLSPRASLDQANTYGAIEAFTVFNSMFPTSTRITESKNLIFELSEKIVEKSYLNAKLYYKLSNYKAAIIALRNSLNDYPNTKYREELMYLLLRSSYLLALNSVPEKRNERYQAAVDEYFSFIGEFPNGKYSSEAKNMYDQSMKKLGDNITQSQL